MNNDESRSAGWCVVGMLIGCLMGVAVGWNTWSHDESRRELESMRRSLTFHGLAEYKFDKYTGESKFEMKDKFEIVQDYYGHSDGSSCKSGGE